MLAFPALLASGKEPDIVETPQSPPAKQLPLRRRRVRTGCITCRVRRVKCDETRPHCARCTSTGRRCDGYEAESVSRNELSRAIRRGQLGTDLQFGSSTFSTSEERQVFDFFRVNSAASGSSNVLGFGFWDRLILQYVHNEPAIKHGVLALSYLHRDFAEGHKAPTATQKPYFHNPAAVRHYGNAVRSASQLFEMANRESAATEKVLTACIIFVIIENMLANPKGARMHLMNGLRIEKEQCRRFGKTRPSGGKDHSKTSVVSQALSRLDYTIMTMSTSEAPYPYGENILRADHAVVVPSRFSSLSEAENYMFAMLRDLFGFAEAVGVSANAFDVLSKITLATTWYAQQLDAWTTAFEQLASRLETLDGANRSRCAVLRVYYKLSYLIGVAAHSSNELAFDRFDDEFSEILDMVEFTPGLLNKGSVESNTFSLEIGVVIPVFMTAFRCRHPQIRRRAIRLLRALRRREIMWDSDGAATCCEWIMNIEENGTHGLLANGRPHDKDRIRVLSADIKHNESKLTVKVFLPSDSGPGNLRTIEDALPLCMGVGSKEQCICHSDASTRLKLKKPVFVDQQYKKLRYDQSGKQDVLVPEPGGGVRVISKDDLSNGDVRAAALAVGSKKYSAAMHTSLKDLYGLDYNEHIHLIWDDDGFFIMGLENLYSDFDYKGNEELFRGSSKIYGFW